VYICMFDSIDYLPLMFIQNQWQHDDRMILFDYVQLKTKGVEKIRENQKVSFGAILDRCVIKFQVFSTSLLVETYAEHNQLTNLPNSELHSSKSPRKFQILFHYGLSGAFFWGEGGRTNKLERSVYRYFRIQQPSKMPSSVSPVMKRGHSKNMTEFMQHHFSHRVNLIHSVHTQFRRLSRTYIYTPKNSTKTLQKLYQNSKKL